MRSRYNHTEDEGEKNEYEFQHENNAPNTELSPATNVPGGLGYISATIAGAVRNGPYGPCTRLY